MTVPCYKSIGESECLFLWCFIHKTFFVTFNHCLFWVFFFLETLPVEAKPVWHKQAIELEEEIIVTEEPA